jgi:hypothetical protein
MSQIKDGWKIIEENEVQNDFLIKFHFSYWEQDIGCRKSSSADIEYNWPSKVIFKFEM